MTAWAETALRRLADRRALRAIQNPACMKDTPEICLGLAINPQNAKIRSRLPPYHNREVSSRNAVGVASVPLRSFAATSSRKEDLWARHQSRRHLQQAEIVPVAAGIRVSGRKHAERIIFE